MASKEHEMFPPVPESLVAHDSRVRGYDSTDSHRVIPDTVPHYTPYLGLQARLSQVWINKWTVLLLLVLCRVLLSIKGLDHDIASAKRQALSACTSVENVGSAMASMPHYMSEGVNSLMAFGVTKAFHGLMDLLTLIVTGVEEIIIFAINMYTQTYLCLITLVITGSLHVAIDMIEKAGALVNSTIAAITKDITSGVSGFQNELNSFLSALGSISGLFGGPKTPPKIDLSSEITRLNSISIDPSQLDAQLTALDSKIPDFAQVNNFTQTILRLPFDEIKSLINQSMSTFTFDKSVFPVAQKQALTFCSDNDNINNFFQGLFDLAHKARIIFIVVVTILAILVCVPMTYREIRSWRMMQQRAGLISKQAYEPMDVVYIVSRPYTSTAGIKIASKFKSSKRQTLVRWAVAYATSIPALFVLTLGIAGLFSCLCQYILMKSVEREVPALANQVGNFADTVVKALNNASEQWSISANHVISKTNTDVNTEILGWVNTTTTQVNATLNMVVDTTMDILNHTFGGTILYDPIVQTLNCLIGLKIATIEKGITWVHDHAHVDFPLIANDTFSLGAAASISNSNSAESFRASPGSSATDDITGAVVDVVDTMSAAITQEAYISTALVCVWLVIVLIGVVRAAIAMLGRDRTRAEGGTVLYTGEGRLPISPRGLHTSTFPQFADGTQTAVVEDPNVAWGVSYPGNEKKGTIPRRIVSTFKHSHARGSSHGELSEKI